VQWQAIRGGGGAVSLSNWWGCCSHGLAQRDNNRPRAKQAGGSVGNRGSEARRRQPLRGARESWRRLAEAKRKVLTRVTDSAERNERGGRRGGVCGVTSVVSALALCHAKSRHASQDGPRRRKPRLFAFGMLPDLGVRTGGGRRSMRASGGGGVSPPAAQRPP
jgi:hypothetical protein